MGKIVKENAISFGIGAVLGIPGRIYHIFKQRGRNEDALAHFDQQLGALRSRFGELVPSDTDEPVIERAIPADSPCKGELEIIQDLLREAYTFKEKREEPWLTKPLRDVFRVDAVAAEIEDQNANLGSAISNCLAIALNLSNTALSKEHGRMQRHLISISQQVSKTLRHVNTLKNKARQYNRLDQEQTANHDFYRKEVKELRKLGKAQAAVFDQFEDELYEALDDIWHTMLANERRASDERAAYARENQGLHEQARKERDSQAAERAAESKEASLEREDISDDIKALHGRLDQFQRALSGYGRQMHLPRTPSPRTQAPPPPAMSSAAQIGQAGLDTLVSCLRTDHDNNAATRLLVQMWVERICKTADSVATDDQDYGGNDELCAEIESLIFMLRQIQTRLCEDGGSQSWLTHHQALLHYWVGCIHADHDAGIRQFSAAIELYEGVGKSSGDPCLEHLGKTYFSLTLRCHHCGNADAARQHLDSLRGLGSGPSLDEKITQLEEILGEPRGMQPPRR